MNQEEKGNWDCKFRLEKRKGDINKLNSALGRKVFQKIVKPYEVIEGEDNCLLNTGIDEIWDLVTGAVSGATHIFDNAAATIGVGDSATAAAASQTDLQSVGNKTYKGMEGWFPTSTTQKVTLKSSFGSSEANYVWNEWGS
jgi:hypothetical protein